MTINDSTPASTAKPARTRRGKATTNAMLATTEPAPLVATPAAAPAGKPTSKSNTVIKLLLRAKGATPLELIAATDWQPHSLRAFLSGLRKKGRTIVRETRKNGDGTYRIVEAEPATTGAAAGAMTEGAPSGAAESADPTATIGADA